MGFQKYRRGSAFFEISKTFIVRMGGLVGRLVGGDQTTPSIFPTSGHLNKHDVLISNMASKIVYTNNIKSYEHFKFQNSKILDDHL